MHAIKTKQKVYGMKGDELVGEDYCAKDEAEAIGEQENKDEQS